MTRSWAPPVPAAGVVEIHQTSMAEDGTMAMAPVTEIPIPAHADAVLEPGGYHIMLIQLVEPLVEGGQIELTLEFANAAPQTVMVPVQAMGPHGHGHGRHGHGRHGHGRQR